MAQRLLSAIVTAAALMLVPAPSFGQSGAAVPYDGLAFDDVQHRRWYARFWTGECRELNLFVCFPGRPYWHETSKKLAAEAAPERRAALALRLFALGRRIGHEWAKENDVRKVSTDDIRRWYRDLEKAGNAEAALARIEAEAERLLTRK